MNQVVGIERSVRFLYDFCCKSARSSQSSTVQSLCLAILSILCDFVPAMADGSDQPDRHQQVGLRPNIMFARLTFSYGCQPAPMLSANAMPPPPFVRHCLFSLCPSVHLCPSRLPTTGMMSYRHRRYPMTTNSGRITPFPSPRKRAPLPMTSMLQHLPAPALQHLPALQQPTPQWAPR